jgi:glycosyltransferase involved in cell wall biosynthesis
MKVALVHDYLTQRGGAERVFELLCQYFPEADIFTSLYNPDTTIDLGDRPVHTTYLQKIPGASKKFRLFAPFYFSAFRSLDLQEYDLIISSSSSFAKVVRKRPGAKHICFCHNVTRFLWDTQTYLGEYKDFQRFSPMIEPVFQAMRKIDVNYSQEPDLYIANSSIVAERINKIYQKQAMVINYPIDPNNFSFSTQKENFYLVSSRLLSYKKIDVIIDAFNLLGWPLLITGDGPERKNLETKAMPNIKFLGYVNDEERKVLMSKSRSVIVAALEDYGLVPIEANVSGTPVISYGKGGVLDTQIPAQTGVFFNRQTPDAICQALLEAEQITWDYNAIRNHVLSNFTKNIFFNKIKAALKDI